MRNIIKKSMSTTSLLNFEEVLNSYSGLYFVLHDEINVKKNVGLNKDVVKKLMELLKKKKFSEIIFATN